MAFDTTDRNAPACGAPEPVSPEPPQPTPPETANSDEVPKPKAPANKASDRAVRMAIASGAEFWHSPDLAAFFSFQKGAHRENHAIKSPLARTWLMGMYYTAEKRGLSHQECSDALGQLEAIAIHGGAEYPVAVRVAHLPERVLLDLGGPTWEVVDITCGGWSICPALDLPVRFRRPTGLASLPSPKQGGVITKIREFLNTDEAGICMALAWMVFALGGKGPYPLLALAGEQGTGKSSVARLIREIVDPNSVGLRTAPKEERDLAIAARNAHILSFDNLSTIPDWLADALCRLATGAGFATRALYTDSEESLFSARRPIIINGIPDLMTRGDLADRAMTITLDPIREKDRRPEADLWQAIEAAKPDILGGLLDAVSMALRRLPTLEMESYPRMADFARFIVAAEPAMPWGAGGFLLAYSKSRDEGARDLLEGDVIFPLLVGIIVDGTGMPKGAGGEGSHSSGTWTGTAGDLLADLNVSRGVEKPPRGWPSSPRGLSSHIRRISPAMRLLGIQVEYSKGGGRMNARIMTLSLVPKKDPKLPSDPSDQPIGHTGKENSDRTHLPPLRPESRHNHEVRTQPDTSGPCLDPSVLHESPCIESLYGDSDGSAGSDVPETTFEPASGFSYTVNL